MTSTGNESASVSSATVSGAGFILSGTRFPLRIGPGNTKTIDVAFQPTTVGTASGTLTLVTNSTSGTIVINLSGAGVAASTPQLAVSAASLSFGDVNDGSSATLSVALTSTGTASVTVNSATVFGTGFTVSGAAFPLTLSPQQTATLQMKFSPTTAGAVTGTLTISSNSTANPSVAVSLTGTGVATSPAERQRCQSELRQRR